MFRGDRLRKLRESRNLNEAQLAGVVGATQSQVSDWETGRYGPGRKRVQGLAEFFGVSIEWLRGLSDEENVPAKNASTSPTEGLALDPLGRRMTPLLTWLEAANMRNLVDSCETWDGEHIALPEASANTVAIKVAGTSANLWFRAGDIIVVDLDSTDLDDGRFYVFRDDGVLSLKQYEAERERLVPRSDDPTQTATYLSDSTVEIVGRVIQLIRDV